MDTLRSKSCLPRRVVAAFLCLLVAGEGTVLLTAAEPSGPPIDRLIDFQSYRFGQPPKEFEYDATGPHGPVLSAGRPLWRAYVDLAAPSPRMVLLQASALAAADHFPLAVLRGAKTPNPRLAVSFKVLDGTLSRSAGLLWRAQDKGNYDAVLVNALDRSVRLLRVRQGRAVEAAKAPAAFDANDWNAVAVSAAGDRLAVWLNDRLILEVGAGSPPRSGRVGLITHADTVAVFDDFHIQEGAGPVARKAEVTRRNTARALPPAP
jgi:hypothetical protein